MAEPRIVRLPDLASLSTHVADWLCGISATKGGPFALSLSGGSTPQVLYEDLAQRPFRGRMRWARTHIFWGDERFVPHDHPDSNFRMAREALLDHVPLPPQNIHAMPGTGDVIAAARACEAELRDFYGADTLDPNRPLFDVTLLGLGEDGHTASLFPGTPGLDERSAWVVPVTQNVKQPRLTLTYPAIASSRHVAFMVSGAAKRAILQRVLAGDMSLPASHVTAVGDITWFIDEAAG